MRLLWVPYPPYIVDNFFNRWYRPAIWAPLPCVKHMEKEFDIPLGPVPIAHVNAVFASAAFQEGVIPKEPVGPMSQEDLDWVEETVSNGQKLSPPPSPVAERYLRTAFKHYDFDMPVTEAQWQNFVLTKWYQMAVNSDPKVSKPALDSIAKSGAANLMVEKREINITSRSDEELNKELRDLFKALKDKTNERVIEGEAIRA